MGGFLAATSLAFSQGGGDHYTGVFKVLSKGQSVLLVYPTVAAGGRFRIVIDPNGVSPEWREARDHTVVEAHTVVDVGPDFVVLEVSGIERRIPLSSISVVEVIRRQADDAAADVPTLKDAALKDEDFFGPKHRKAEPRL